MKPKKNTIVIITVILVVMTAFAIRLVNRMDSVQEPVMTDFIRITLHIGLFTAWGFSLFHRTGLSPDRPDDAASYKA